MIKLSDGSPCIAESLTAAAAVLAIGDRFNASSKCVPLDALQVPKSKNQPKKMENHRGSKARVKIAAVQFPVSIY